MNAAVRPAELNLARRPFSNVRPVVRLALLLWVLGLALLAVNVVRYQGYFSGSAERQEEVARLQQQTAAHRQRIEVLDRQLAELRLPQQNAEVRFLNRKIAERTFSWGQLFDRLSEVLPNDVRLTSLTPEALADEDQTAARRRAQEAVAEPRQQRIRLNMTGIARTPEAQLALVEALFDHPAFEHPELSRDNLMEQGQVRFVLSTIYLPARGAEGRPVQVATAEPESPASPGGAGAAGDPADAATPVETTVAETPRGSASRLPLPPAVAPPAAAAEPAEQPESASRRSGSLRAPDPRRPPPTSPVLQPRPPSRSTTRTTTTAGGIAPPATPRPPVPRQPNASASLEPQ